MGTKLLLIVLTLSGVLVFSVPALAQTGPSAGNAQYDQYREPGDQGPGDSVGDRAARDAITARGAIRAAASETQAGDVASAAETPDEETPDEETPEEETPGGETMGPEDASSDDSAAASGPQELPDTGGPSPLWILPLLCAGGLLARRIF